MSGCTSPAYSTSYDESQDRDAVSCSCSPSAELVTSDAHSSSDETEASEPRSAFRPIGVSPLPIHQQLLAILHSELPRPWRCLYAVKTGYRTESCTKRIGSCLRFQVRSIGTMLRDCGLAAFEQL